MDKFGRLLGSLMLFVGLTLIGLFIHATLMEVLRDVGLPLIAAIIVATAVVPGGMFAAARLISKRKSDSIVPTSLYVAMQWVVIMPLVIVQAQMVPLGTGSFLWLPMGVWFFAPGALALILTLVSIFLNATYFRATWPLALSVILLFAVPGALVGDGPSSTLLYAGMLYFIVPVLLVTMVIIGILRRL